jgi:pyruvate,water dikinase
VCNDVLRSEAADAGFPDLDIAALAVGSSPASARPARLVAAIADALVEAGVTDGGAGLSTLADVRAVSPAVAARLDEYLDEYGWRLVESYDPSYPALVEQPAVILGSIRACLGARWRREAASGPPVPPWGEGHPRLDALLEDARALHAMRDDDDGTCFFWPLGLVRRAVLEAGRRLVAEDRLVAVTDLFEATTAEILGLLHGSSTPDASELSRRAAARVAAGEVAPPPSLGGGDEGSSGAAVANADRPPLSGTPIGTGVGSGRARVHRSGDDVLGSIEPGDVLVTLTTTPAFNTVFPLLAGVVCEVGSTRSHAALLSRELGVPCVVGVAGALSSIPDGALVEVDGDTGICTLL